MLRTRLYEVRLLAGGPSPTCLCPEGTGASLRSSPLRVRIPAGAPDRYLGVAQPGRAPASGAGDRGFESPHPDHHSRPEGAGARLRISTIQVRVLAGVPQGGTGPDEAHNLVPVGAIPTPATAAIPWREAALMRPAQRVRLPPSRPPHNHTRDERAGERSGSTHRPRRVRSPGPAPRRRSPTEGGNRLRSGSVWVRLPLPAPDDDDHGVGRYGDLSSLIRSSFRVRLTATPPEDTRGARSLGEHRHDEPAQVGSIPTPRTTPP